MAKLTGWKSIIGCLAIGVLSLALKLDWITLDLYTSIMAVVGPLTGITMALKGNRISKALNGK